jgi:hypothetical protein
MAGGDRDEPIVAMTKLEYEQARNGDAPVVDEGRHCERCGTTMLTS